MVSLYVIAGFVIIPLFALGIYAQSHVKKVYRQYAQVPLKKGITGSRVARTMINAAGLTDVVIEEVGTELADHYDPRQKIIRLSKRVSRGASLAAVGIAAHEAAHAIQDGTGYEPARIRDAMAPIISKSSYVVLPLLLFGLRFGRIGASTVFVNIAIVMYLGIVLFYLVTLPLELEASARALRYIKEKKIADEEELRGIRAVLRAAAMTYVIVAALAIAQFIRLLGMTRSK